MESLQQTWTSKAELVGTFENGSTDWLQARMQGIGGSDVGTIAGVNKYSTPTDLWAYKTGRAPGATVTGPMEWGNRLEPVVLDKFQDEHPELQVLRDVGSWRNIEQPWQLANPDAIAVSPLNDYLIEVKTARYPWKDGIPASYVMQVQWYMHVLGLQQALVVVLFGGNEYKEYLLEANSFTQRVLVEQSKAFLRYVYDDLPPDMWEA
tara:strand:- start:829 stop:1449 length:621 start_codon:yes stop_codon:yes gene_type:complete